jgi:hypothetical protein
MKNVIPAFLLLALLLSSCTKDHKKEAISNYVRYIWRINTDNRMELLTLEETAAIRGKDSLEILVKQFSQGEKNTPTVDTLMANYEKDDLYNSSLLKRTEAKIDSFKKVGKEMADNSFFVEYTKSLEQLRNFTAGQLAELRAEKYLLEKYKNDPDEILCRQIHCRYKIKKEAPDTTSKVYTQIFYLSEDGRRVLAVKQDSSANKKPGQK